MENLFEFNLRNIIIFLIPGFISIKVWSLLVASEYEKIKDIIFETIIYSCVNYAILSKNIN
jgi:hypothetical protein